MTPRIHQDAHEKRRQLKALYGELFEAIATLLFRHDPVGINYETNADEYEPEARTILPRLRECRSEADVNRVVGEEFDRWFGDSAGANKNYEAIAKEIWELWQKHNAKL